MRKRKSWREVFRQPEQDVLRYLDKVAEAWKKRDQLGITPLERRQNPWQRERSVA